MKRSRERVPDIMNRPTFGKYTPPSTSDLDVNCTVLFVLAFFLRYTTQTKIFNRKAAKKFIYNF